MKTIPWAALATALTCVSMLQADDASKPKKPPAEKKPTQAVIEVTVSGAQSLKPGDAPGVTAKIQAKAIVKAETDLVASIHSLRFFMVNTDGKHLGEPPLAEKKKAAGLKDASFLKKGQMREFPIDLSLSGVAVEPGKQYTLVVRGYGAVGRKSFKFTAQTAP